MDQINELYRPLKNCIILGSSVRDEAPGNMAGLPRAEMTTRLHPECQFQLMGCGYLECYVEENCKTQEICRKEWVIGW